MRPWPTRRLRKTPAAEPEAVEMRSISEGDAGRVRSRAGSRRCGGIRCRDSDAVEEDSTEVAAVSDIAEHGAEAASTPPESADTAAVQQPNSSQTKPVRGGRPRKSPSSRSGVRAARSDERRPRHAAVRGLRQADGAATKPAETPAAAPGGDGQTSEAPAGNGAEQPQQEPRRERRFGRDRAPGEQRARHGDRPEGGDAPQFGPRKRASGRPERPRRAPAKRDRNERGTVDRATTATTIAPRANGRRHASAATSLIRIRRLPSSPRSRPNSSPAARIASASVSR